MYYPDVKKHRFDVLLEDYGFRAEGADFSDPDLTIAIPEVREAIFETGRSSERLVEADRYLFENIRGIHPDTPEDPAQPIEKWWWHLQEIKKGRYPAEILPEHLRCHVLKLRA